MARKRLTIRFIDSVKPPKAGRVEYWDAGTPGFGLRVSDSGRKTWVLMYRHRRRLRRLTLGTYPALSLAGARDKAKAALRQVADGTDPAEAKKVDRHADTFSDLAEQYIDRYAKDRKRSWKEDRRALDRDLLPRFGNRKASDIKRREVIDCLEAIKARGAPVLANRTLEIIRRIYNWGIGQEIIEANPCTRIEPPGAKVSRDRVLNDDEIRAIWVTLDQRPLSIAARFRLMFLTAQRPGEVRHLRWQDVDRAAGWWTVPGESTKNRLTHRVPLSAQALEVLDQLGRSGGDEWVFPSPTISGPIRSNAKALKRIREASEVQFWAHDIRRTVASRLTGDLGVSRLTVSKILNHVETGITATYDRHSYDQEKRHALEAWGRRLDEILADRASETPGNVLELSGTPR